MDIDWAFNAHFLQSDALGLFLVLTGMAVRIRYTAMSLVRPAAFRPRLSFPLITISVREARIPMADLNIRMRPNGPFLVEGPFTLTDSEGNAFTIDSAKPAIALCRCGASGNRPFCDGSHKTCGFESDERASA